MMEYKGKREIKLDEATDAFAGRALSAILDDMELDFDLAELEYADEDEMDVCIDGEDWVVCYDQDEEGFQFHLVTADEFEENYYRYATYDEDDDPDFSDDDFSEDDDDLSFGYEGAREIKAGPEVSIFHIVSLNAFLNASDIDFDEATITFAGDDRMEVEIDGEKLTLYQGEEDGMRFLTAKEEEEENPNIIPFRKK